MKYMKLENDIAYRLINTGGVVLVSTKSTDGMYDIAPVAWNCPIKKSPTQILIALGKRHQSYKNIMEEKAFVAVIPHINQLAMIKNTGSVSGEDINKFEEFQINALTGEQVDAKIPSGAIAYIECKLVDVYDRGSLALCIGETLTASVDEDAYGDDRLLSEKAAGKTVHHLGSSRFISPGDILFKS